MPSSAARALVQSPPAPAGRLPFYERCPLCERTGYREVIAFPELQFVRCEGCGLIYKREQVAALGVGYEEEYFRFNRAKYLERWAHRVRKCRRQLLACLEYAPGARDVLDVGCSAGYVLEAARSLGLSPTGLDCSRFAVALCRERGYRAELGELERMPFPDASFDVVTLKHTLEHVRSPLAGLTEIARVLRPGGIAFVIVPDAAYWKILWMPRQGRSFRPDRRGWQHHVYFDDATLAEGCARAGLVALKQGKAIFRRRLARGLGAPLEWARYGWLRAWTFVCKALHLRREIQLIAQLPAHPGPKAP